MTNVPDLSRFELQCLRILQRLGEGTVRDIRRAFPDPPGYTTVKKIIERLEAKGAIRRVGKRENAWVYGSTVTVRALVHYEIRRFLDLVFDGAAAPLVARLAEMDALSLGDLREIEDRLGKSRKKKGPKAPRGRSV
jgi:BlaI family penicillinase repressor